MHQIIWQIWSNWSSWCGRGSQDGCVIARLKGSEKGWDWAVSLDHDDGSLSFHRWTNALLPSGSPFGDPGPHGDLFQFLGPQKVPIFFQGPHFIYFRLKNALKVHYYPCPLHIKGWIFRDTSIQWKWHKPVYQMKPHPVKMFFHNSSPLYFKNLACFDQS